MYGIWDTSAHLTNRIIIQGKSSSWPKRVETFHLSGGVWTESSHILWWWSCLQYIQWWHILPFLLAWILVITGDSTTGTIPLLLAVGGVVATRMVVWRLRRKGRRRRRRRRCHCSLSLAVIPVFSDRPVAFYCSLCDSDRIGPLAINEENISCHPGWIRCLHQNPDFPRQ